MTSPPRVRFSTILAVLAVLASTGVGCATPESKPSESPTFADRPVGDNPRLDLKWRQNIGLDGLQTYQPNEFAHPVLLRQAKRYNVVAASRTGDVTKLRGGDGKLRWRTSLDEPVHATPAYDKRRVFVGTLAGSIVALDRQTGDVQWKIERTHGIESRPAVTDRGVFVTTNAGKLVALDREDGTELWTYERSTPREFTIKGSGAPVVDDGSVYCGFSDGTLAALDVATGREQWTADLSGDETEFTDVISPIVVRDKRIFAASYSAGIFALEKTTGSLIWTNPLENVSSLEPAGLSLYATLATGRVVALATEDGSTLWGLQLEENLPVEASQAGPYLFVSTGAGPLYVINRSTGHPAFEWNPSSGFNSRTVFSKRRGYVLSDRGFLYAFRVAW